MIIDTDELLRVTKVSKRKLPDALRDAGVPFFEVAGRVFTTEQALTQSLLDPQIGGMLPDYGAIATSKRL